MPTSFRYPFATDVAAGEPIPVPADHPALEVLNGTWGVSGGRPFTSSAAGSNPILAARAGRGDFDITSIVNSNGGDCIYARIVDGANWLRARLRRYQVWVDTSYNEYEWTWQTGWTEYKWNQGYSHDWSTDAYHGDNYTQTPGSVTRVGYNDSTTTAPTFASTTSVSHTDQMVASPYTKYSVTGPYIKVGSATRDTSYSRFVATANKAAWGTSSTTAPSGAPTSATTTNTKAGYSGNSRLVSSGYYDTRYQVVLERCVAGAVSTIATAASSATSLRFRGVGTSLQVFINGSASAGINVTDTHATTSTWVNQNRHGIGRGTSDLSGTSGIDDLVINTVNDPPRAPVLGTLPRLKAGGTVSWTPDDPEGDAQASWRLYRTRTSTPNVREYWDNTNGVWTSTVVTNTGTTTSTTFPRGAWRRGAYDLALETADAKGMGAPRVTRVFIPGGMAMVM